MPYKLQVPKGYIREQKNREFEMYLVSAHLYNDTATAQPIVLEITCTI